MNTFKEYEFWFVVGYSSMVPRPQKIALHAQTMTDGLNKRTVAVSNL